MIIMTDKMRRFIMVILALVFCVSAFHFGKAFLEYRKGDRIYEATQTIVQSAPGRLFADRYAFSNSVGGRRK